MKRYRERRWIVVLTLFSAVAFAADRQPKYLDKETYFQMESVSNPSISPDGSQIVFTRSRAEVMTDQEQSNLWLVDINGRRPRELTQGTWRDSTAAWSPDGKRIAFMSDRSGTRQIHVMWIGSHEVSQLTHLEHAPANLRWSPNGKWIAFNMAIPDETNLLPVKMPKVPKGAQLAKPAVIVDRLSWGRDGFGQTVKEFNQAFVVDATIGGAARQITQGNYNHSGPEWSSDGKTIYVSGIRKPNPEYLHQDSEIYAIDVDSGSVKALTDRKGPDREPRVSPDGKWIAYTGNDEKGYTNHLSNLYLMDSSGGSKRVWADNLANSPSEVQWAHDNSGVYFTVSEAGTTNLYFAALSGAGGKPRKVTSGAQVLNGVSVSDNGQVAAVRSSFKEPGTLVTFALQNPAEVKKLVDVNAEVLNGVKLADVEEMWFPSSDGLKIQGWLMKPANFVPGKKYPLLLYIHGGPWSLYTVAFNWDWQNFAANGYAVLYLNPRGSTGYGQEFVNGIQYSYPGKDYDDLMAGVDVAIAKGFIDEDNLFVCGGSGGGVLTVWIVGHTNRFRAAVSMRPVIDWGSFVGITDGARWDVQFHAYPWADAQEYAVRSPLHYVANVTTPTMVMTGESDLRTPIVQSEEFYRALKMLHKETLMVRMPEEFHGWRRPSHRLLQQLYLQAWFEKWRKKDGRPDVVPTAGSN